MGEMERVFVYPVGKTWSVVHASSSVEFDTAKWSAQGIDIVPEGDDSFHTRTDAIVAARSLCDERAAAGLSTELIVLTKAGKRSGYWTWDVGPKEPEAAPNALLGVVQPLPGNDDTPRYRTGDDARRRGRATRRRARES